MKAMMPIHSRLAIQQCCDLELWGKILQQQLLVFAGEPRTNAHVCHHGSCSAGPECHWGRVAAGAICDEHFFAVA
jgi:hypothetical protein